MSSKTNCCYGCTDRNVGCHSTCEKYKELKAKIDERNENIRNMKQANSEFISYRKSLKFRSR